MARGWESKGVEAQQEEAARGTQKGRRPPTPEELDRRRQRRTLELARASAEADLSRARADRHREMLQQTLASIDERLRDLQ
ncbi:MAG TPA: hypothetical protein VK911_01610 [Vicinamibacterales bacterium]|nr:hypothetical protein [Vicinamibacterales bacterium]